MIANTCPAIRISHLRKWKCTVELSSDAVDICRDDLRSWSNERPRVRPSVRKFTLNRNQGSIRDRWADVDET